MRLLLVEDDAMIGEAVLHVLRAEHYAVDWVRDGSMADDALRSEQYDLVLLDLGLPKRDGLAVLHALRARHNSVPVLVATARDAIGDRIAALKDTLRIFAEMVGGISVKPEAMERAALKGYATATDLADYLVKKGLPFRDAHETVAHAVKAAISHGVDLSELPLEVLQQFNPKIEKDVYGCLSLRGSLNARDILGGTAPNQVRAQIARHRARLGN